MKNTKKYEIIILAAGSSSRLGKAKQLELYYGDTLLNHTLTVAKNSFVKDITIILGANANHIIPSLKDCQYRINTNWANGMGNSIAFAASKLKIDTDAVIFLLCDQPHLESKIINELIVKFELGDKDIIRCKYSTGFGPPILFDKKYFKLLSNLDGEMGAISIVQNHKDDVDYIDFEKGAIDIDTEEDLKYLKVD